MAAVFTICFEDPFWVGVLESEEGGRLVVARHVFGAEPSNAELLEFMLTRFASMPRAEAASEEARHGPARLGPKRAIREAARDGRRPPSTKAQAALSAAREASKAEWAALSRRSRRDEAERRFELRSERRKRRRAGH